MNTCGRASLATMFAIGFGCLTLAAQSDEAPAAITARVHGTFLDGRGGLGVLSGDMTVVRFDAASGTLTAIGRIDGTLADSAGTVLGQVAQELALPVSGVAATCNQLRMDLASSDAVILQMAVHFDGEVAGFDSRDGTTPKALAVLCTTGELLRGQPSAAALARALNGIAAALAPARSLVAAGT